MARALILVGTFMVIISAHARMNFRRSDAYGRDYPRCMVDGTAVDAVDNNKVACEKVNCAQTPVEWIRIDTYLDKECTTPVGVLFHAKDKCIPLSQSNLPTAASYRYTSNGDSANIEHFSSDSCSSATELKNLDLKIPAKTADGKHKACIYDDAVGDYKTYTKTCPLWKVHGHDKTGTTNIPRVFRWFNTSYNSPSQCNSGNGKKGLMYQVKVYPQDFCQAVGTSKGGNMIYRKNLCHSATAARSHFFGDSNCTKYFSQVYPSDTLVNNATLPNMTDPINLGACLNKNGGKSSAFGTCSEKPFYLGDTKPGTTKGTSVAASDGSAACDGASPPDVNPTPPSPPPASSSSSSASYVSGSRFVESASASSTSAYASSTASSSASYASSSSSGGARRLLYASTASSYTSASSVSSASSASKASSASLASSASYASSASSASSAPAPPPKQQCCVCSTRPTPAPGSNSAPAPTPTSGSASKYLTISATVQLSGVTLADFTPGVREAFKVVVAQGTNLSITSAHVAITNATDVPATGRRASATVLEVSFTINTGSRDWGSAMGASSTLNKFLADPNGFLAALKKEVAKAGLKFDVTKVTVTKKASVDTPSISPTPVNYKVDSSDLAGWAIALIIVACVVFCCIPCTLACFCFWPSIAIAIGLSHAHTEERGVAYKGDASANPPPQMQQTDMGPEPKDTTLSGI